MKIFLMGLLSLGLGSACVSNDVKPEAKEKVVMPAKPAPKMIKPAPAVLKKSHWSYAGAFGPQFWGNLDSNYSMCKDGKSQSPVNLVWSAPKKSGSNLSIAYKETKLNLVDTGHGIQLNVDPGSSMNHNGSSFELKQLHVHTPSEHQLSGKSYPAEMHFVHKSASGKLSVIGVFFRAGKENPMFAKLFAKMPSEKKMVMTDMSFIYTPSVLIPSRLNHYNYQGSLTTPPCSEGVNWIVLNTPVEVSMAQIDQLKAFYKANNRPVQPMNGRSYSNY